VSKLKLSKRVEDIDESVTLKLNSKAVALAKEGKEIYNLTAGQLTFRPPSGLVNFIRSELDFINSFQYSPVAGIVELRKKVLDYFEKSRNIKTNNFDVLISNGAKHSISNVLAATIEEGDEVILFTPYWVTYPEIVKYYGGKIVTVEGDVFNGFIPSIDELKRKMSSKTKAIILNSPNNPSGIQYPKEWMEEFSKIMLKYKNTYIISDEIYFELNYFDPKPEYFYQFDNSLLEQTIIIDGISKALASTGLRIGFTIAPEKIIKAMTRLQGHTTSSPNSLIQRALLHYDFSDIEVFLDPIKKHLRENVTILRDYYTKFNMGHLWYQPTGAFYYLIDFTPTPVMKKFKSGSEDNSKDYSFEICEKLLDEVGIAVVPGGAFGMPNTARLSTVLERDYFSRAVEKLMNFLWKK